MATILNDPALVAQPLGGQAQMVTEMDQIRAAEIAQLHPFLQNVTESKR